jgi:hypothetical protein
MDIVRNCVFSLKKDIIAVGTFKRGTNQEAIWMSMVGQEEVVPCTSCKNGFGAFASCITVADCDLNDCASCHFGGNPASRCSFRSASAATAASSVAPSPAAVQVLPVPIPVVPYTPVKKRKKRAAPAAADPSPAKKAKKNATPAALKPLIFITDIFSELSRKALNKQVITAKNMLKVIVPVFTDRKLVYKLLKNAEAIAALIKEYGTGRTIGLQMFFRRIVNKLNELKEAKAEEMPFTLKI